MMLGGDIAYAGPENRPPELHPSGSGADTILTVSRPGSSEAHLHPNLGESSSPASGNLIVDLLGDECLQSFLDGDRLGTSWVRQRNSDQHFVPGPAENVSLLFRETTGSDLVRLFCRFTRQYLWTGDYRRFVTDWWNFHEIHRQPGLYGDSWRNHFASIEFLRDGSKLSFGGLASMAKSRANSKGAAENGVLALAYPVWLYSQLMGEEPHRLAKMLAMASHAHHVTLAAISNLIDYFEGHCELGDLACPPHSDLLALSRLSALAPYALRLAATCAQSETWQEIAERAMEIGGDVAAILSLALLLKEFKRSWPRLVT